MSLNIRGLRNQRKMRNIFSYLKDQNCAVYLLQETFSKPQDELIWKTEWRGEIFFSHGSNHRYRNLHGRLDRVNFDRHVTAKL